MEKSPCVVSALEKDCHYLVFDT